MVEKVYACIFTGETYGGVAPELYSSEDKAERAKQDKMSPEEYVVKEVEVQ